jgi:hypothetical protein
MTNLLTLATQIEQATEDQQREMLCDAYELLARRKAISFEIAAGFMRCIDAEAYESAAMMLVPENCLAMVRHLWDGDHKAGHAVLNSYAASGEDADGKMWTADFTAVAHTPALALAAACCRAVAQMGEGSGDGR